MLSMKVRVNYTVHLSKTFIEAFNEFYGYTGKPTKAQLRDYFESHGSSCDEMILRSKHAFVKKEDLPRYVPAYRRTS